MEAPGKNESQTLSTKFSRMSSGPSVYERYMAKRMDKIKHKCIDSYTERNEYAGVNYMNRLTKMKERKIAEQRKREQREKKYHYESSPEMSRQNSVDSAEFERRLA